MFWKRNILLLFCVCSVLVLYGCAWSTRAPVSGPDSDLHRAIEKNDLEGVRTALAAGARLNEQSDWTPLMYAAVVASPKTFEFLLQNGADVKVTTPKGYTVLMKIAGGEYVTGSPQYYSVEARIAKAKLLLEKGADINAKTKEGNTALISAARAGSVEFIKFLSSMGAKYPESPVLVLGFGVWSGSGVWWQKEGVFRVRTDEPQELYRYLVDRSPREWSILTIKPGLCRLSVSVEEYRGSKPAFGGARETFAKGTTEVTFKAKQMGIYVVEYEIFENTWRAWVSNYEPSE